LARVVALPSAGGAASYPASRREGHDAAPRDVRWAIHHLDGYVVEVAVDGTRWLVVIAGMRRAYDRVWLDAVGFTGDKCPPVHLCFDGNALHAILASPNDSPGAATHSS